MLLRLMALPVVGPLKAVKLVADTALDTYYDPAVIIAEFTKLKEMKAAGEIGDEEYDEEKARLNERLRHASQRRASKNGG